MELGGRRHSRDRRDRGAGRAVGRATAGRGGRLVVTGRNTERLAAVAEEVGAEHRIALDLVDVDAVAAAVDQSAERLRRVGRARGRQRSRGVRPGPARRVTSSSRSSSRSTPWARSPPSGPRSATSASGGAIAVLTAILADMPTAGMAAYSASKAATSAYLTAIRRELRRDGITVLDARPPHMETGLADRPLAGEAPRMPAGHDIDEVVELIVTGLVDGRSELVADPKERTVLRCV